MLGGVEGKDYEMFQKESRCYTEDQIQIFMDFDFWCNLQDVNDENSMLIVSLQEIRNSTLYRRNPPFLLILEDFCISNVLAHS